MKHTVDIPSRRMSAMTKDNFSSDLSDSVYKEAVTKLKILLSATQLPMENIGDSFSEQLKCKKYPISKSLDHLNNFDRDDDDRNIGSGKRDTLFAKLPPRQPNSSVRRQLFPAMAKVNDQFRSRHNSWHNLTHLDRVGG